MSLASAARTSMSAEAGSAAPSTNTGMLPEQHRSIIGTRKINEYVRAARHPEDLQDSS